MTEWKETDPHRDNEKDVSEFDLRKQRSDNVSPVVFTLN